MGKNLLLAGLIISGPETTTELVSELNDFYDESGSVKDEKVAELAKALDSCKKEILHNKGE